MARRLLANHPLSFERADRELCFDRICPDLRMPEENLHFPKADLTSYSRELERSTLPGHAGRTG